MIVRIKDEKESLLEPLELIRKPKFKKIKQKCKTKKNERSNNKAKRVGGI